MESVQLVELGLRWLHFAAGVLWIGLLYFFNFVNANFAPTMDGETKKKVVPQLLPRALYFFRWGAAYTWVTGVLLVFLVYYHGYDSSYLFEGQHPKAEFIEWMLPLVALLLGFVVYDLIFKALAKQHAIAVVLWALVAIGFAFVCREVWGFSARATYIHVGGLFGTAMAANVWMRIWPAQRRIITAIKNGQTPDPADPALAALRSKHNTYMSVPLLLFMVSVHQDMMLSKDYRWFLPAVLVIGFAVTYAIFGKAKKVQGF